jgi:putative inorganic carbon (HCO3(-)) transporter
MLVDSLRGCFFPPTFNLQFEKYSSYFTDMLTVIVVFYMTTAAIRTPKQARSLVYFFLALTLFVCVQCYVQVTQGTNVAGVGPVMRFVGYEGGTRMMIPQTRWIGVFLDPNDTGMLIVALAPLAFASAMFVRNSPLVKVFWAAAFFTMVYAIYTTNSRGTFLALLAALGMFFIVKYRSAIGFAFAVIAGTVLLAVGPSRMGSAASGDDSAMERVYTWILSLHLLPQYPIFGIGPQNWGEYHHLTTHNSFVLAMVETGVPGYALYLAIFIAAATAAARVALKTESKDIATVGAALVACMVAVMVSAFFISRTYVLIPFFVAALVLAYSRVLDADLYAAQINALKPVLLLAAAIASIVGLWLINIASTRIAYG